MKRAIVATLKRALRPFWWLTGPIRRPLAQKFDSHVARIVDQSLATALVGPSARLEAATAALGRIEESVHVGRHVVEHQNADANMLLDGMIREVARLQMQVEALREAVDEAQARGALSVVAGDDEERKVG